MRLPSFKRLVEQDFDKDNQGLIRTLAGVLNYGIEVLYQALNRNVSIRDNIKCTVKDITVIVDSTGTPTQNNTFLVDIPNSRVEGVTVISAVNQTNSNHYPTSGVFISGVQNTNSYLISKITGLQTGETYTLRLICWLS